MNEILQQIPMGLIIGYLFIIGMCLGSFFLVVGWRVPKKESLLTRSHCDDCQQTLGARDLIPVLSYLILKGKCRKCQKKFPLIAFLYEVLIGMLFTGTTLLFWGTAEVIAAWCLLALLAIISASDIFYQLIPNKVLAPFFAGGIGLRLIQPQNEFWWYWLVGFFAGFLPLYLLAELSKKGMGGGDIKLFAVLGVYIGPVQVLTVLFVASCLAVIFYVIQMLRGKVKSRYIAFGPFIAIATGMVYLGSGWFL